MTNRTKVLMDYKTNYQLMTHIAVVLNITQHWLVIGVNLTVKNTYSVSKTWQ